MLTYPKGKKIGLGSGGKVYESKSPGGTEIAIKCNFKGDRDDFATGLRELNVNNRLSRHPNITPLHKAFIGNPFNDGMISPPGPNESINLIHYIFPKASSDLNSYFKGKNHSVPFNVVKKLMVDILLGVEHIHASGFMHRDLKEQNILIFDKGDGNPIAKICDFGLAKQYIPNVSNTPGVMTQLWRAPEIVIKGSEYDQKSDMWSVGCIFYFMITGRNFVFKKDDCNSQREKNNLLKLIISSLPYEVDVVGLYKFSEGKVNLTPCLEKKTFEQCFSLNNVGNEIIEKAGGYQNFKNFMISILSFYPSSRVTATEALSSEFLKEHREYINEVRKNFPPVSIADHEFKIVDCIERKWGMELLLNVYINRKRFNWYKDILIFHCLVFYDMMLVHLEKGKNINIVEGEFTGQILSCEDAELLLYSCLYMSIKYFHQMTSFEGFIKITGKTDMSQSSLFKVGEYERKLYMEVLQYMIYRNTPYEYIHFEKKATDEEIKSLLYMMICGKHSGLTAKQAYELMWKPNEKIFLESFYQVFKSEGMNCIV